jgi:hypothetical protein
MSLVRFAAALAVAAAVLLPGLGSAQSPAPAPGPVFIGPTPDPSGTACPGESGTEHVVSGPERIAIPAASAAYFKAHNPRSYVLFVLVVRFDGKAAIQIAANQDLDAPLREAMIAYAQSLKIVPAIANCARPGAVMVGHAAIPDGAITFTVQMVPPSPSPEPPKPLPSL